MNSICESCEQENCPRCIEKSEERRKSLEWIARIVTGLILYGGAKTAYYIGKVNGRFEKEVEIEVQKRIKEDQEEDS